MFHELISDLSGLADPEAALARCLEAALTLAKLEQGVIYLLDEKSAEWTPVVQQGLASPAIERVSRDELSLAIEGKPLYGAYLNAILLDDERYRKAGIYTIAIIPICHFGAVIAQLSLHSKSIDEIPHAVRLDLEIIGGIIGNLLARCKIEAENRCLDEQLRQSQKLEAIGTLAGGIAHDMNNVLAGIMGLATLLREETNPADLRFQDIEKILDASRRGSSLTQNLLNFARKGETRRTGISLNRIVHQVEGLLERTILKKIVINTNLDDSLTRVEGDPGQLTHALVNLCLNAIDAMDEEGELTMSTSAVTFGKGELSRAPNRRPGQYAVLEVRDTGRGIDEQNLEKVFDPFFTTKAPGQGTGLGLSMVRNTVRNHNGSIFIESAPHVGTSVKVYLPAFESKAPRQVTTYEFETTVQSGSGTILLVDDEEIIRITGQRLLEKLGYSVIIAENGQVALDIFKQWNREIDLVILDMAMPVLDGAECLPRLKRINPRVRVLISSGFANKKTTEKLFGNQEIDFLAKPFEIGHLSEAVARAIRSGTRMI